MNLIRTLLFSLLLAAASTAQVTLPSGLLPFLETAQSVMTPDRHPPVPIDCGSSKAFLVTVTDRVSLYHPMSWPPPDWDNWEGEEQQEFLDWLAIEALMVVGSTFPPTPNPHLDAWEKEAIELALQGVVCNPCPSCELCDCMSSATAGMFPILYSDVSVVSIFPFYAGVILTVDFSVDFGVVVTCDTKDGCR